MGTPEEIYRRPATEFVARFMGEINLLPPGSPWRTALGITGDGPAGVRPEAVRVGGGGVDAVVRSAQFLGSKVELEVALEGSASIKAWTPSPIAPGTRVTVSVAAGDVLRFPA